MFVEVFPPAIYLLSIYLQQILFLSDDLYDVRPCYVYIGPSRKIKLKLGMIAIDVSSGVRVTYYVTLDT